MTEQTYAGRVVLAIRQQRGWTQAQCAAELGVCERTVRRWENGEVDPNIRDMALFRMLLQADTVSAS